MLRAFRSLIITVVVRCKFDIVVSRSLGEFSGVDKTELHREKKNDPLLYTLFQNIKNWQYFSKSVACGQQFGRLKEFTFAEMPPNRGSNATGPI